MEDLHFEDRRIFERFKVNLPLVCSEQESAHNSEVDAFDISAEGLGVISNAELKPGAEMNLSVRIPALNKEFPAHGTVVWTRKYYTRFRAGVRLDPSCFMGISTILRMLHSLPV